MSFFLRLCLLVLLFALPDAGAHAQSAPFTLYLAGDGGAAPSADGTPPLPPPRFPLTPSCAPASLCCPWHSRLQERTHHRPPSPCTSRVTAAPPPRSTARPPSPCCATPSLLARRHAAFSSSVTMSTRADSRRRATPTATAASKFSTPRSRSHAWLQVRRSSFPATTIAAEAASAEP